MALCSQIKISPETERTVKKQNFTPKWNTFVSYVTKRIDYEVILASAFSRPPDPGLNTRTSLHTQLLLKLAGPGSAPPSLCSILSKSIGIAHIGIHAAEAFLI